MTEAKQVEFPKGGFGQYFQMQQRLNKIKIDSVSYISNQSLVSPDPGDMGQRCPCAAEIKWG